MWARVHVVVYDTVFLVLSVFPWRGVLLVSHRSYEGEGVGSLCLSYPHLSRGRGSDVHMGVGWAGYCAPGGSVGLWGRPGPAPRVENVFRVGGRETEPPVCLGGRVGGASHWALGFSGILYLSSRRAGRGWWWGESRHAADMAYLLPALEEGT